MSCKTCGATVIMEVCEQCEKNMGDMESLPEARVGRLLYAVNTVEKAQQEVARLKRQLLDATAVLGDAKIKTRDILNNDFAVYVKDMDQMQSIVDMIQVLTLPK